VESVKVVTATYMLFSLTSIGIHFFFLPVCTVHQ